MEMILFFGTVSQFKRFRYIYPSSSFLNNWTYERSMLIAYLRVGSYFLAAHGFDDYVMTGSEIWSTHDHSNAVSIISIIISFPLTFWWWLTFHFSKRVTEAFKSRVIQNGVKRNWHTIQTLTGIFFWAICILYCLFSIANCLVIQFWI